MLFVLDTVVAPEFGGGPRAGLRVGGPGRGGEDVGKVGVGASGHGQVEPLPVFAAGDQRDAGVDGGTLGGVPGDRVGEIGCLVAVVAEGAVGEPALAGGRVGVEHSAGHDAAAGDGLDPQDVPVGQGPAGLACLEVVVVGPADDQVPGGGFAAVGDPDRPACVDEAEVDQVVADPGGQLAAAGPGNRRALVAAARDARRLLVSRMVLEHRLAADDPLGHGTAEWEDHAIHLLLADAPVPLAQAQAVLKH